MVLRVHVCFVSQLTRAMIRFTVGRRIVVRRRLNHASTLIQRCWRERMFRIKVKAATMILPLLRRHLWYNRRQRLRSLRHDAARAMQVL
jgi:hypothetical protein